jgi:hypothetical protein
MGWSSLIAYRGLAVAHRLSTIVGSAPVSPLDPFGELGDGEIDAEGCILVQLSQKVSS